MLDNPNLFSIKRFEELERRLTMIEEEINCKNLENKIKVLENEVKHLKEVLQYQLRKKK